MKIIRFFDRLEDRVRGWLSHYPIFYAIVGGIGTVLFWRGVWLIADFLSLYYLGTESQSPGVIKLPSLVDGSMSFVGGLVMLLMTGLFVATFIGDHIIISGLRREKKVTEKTEVEVEEGENVLKKIHDELHVFSRRLEEIEKKVDSK